MAPRGDLQREPGQGGRAVSEEGRQGVSRGPAADPQIHRQGRRREILDRDRAAALPRRAGDARQPRRRRRWRRLLAAAGARGGAAKARPASTATRWTTRSRSEPCGGSGGDGDGLARACAGLAAWMLAGCAASAGLPARRLSRRLRSRRPICRSKGRPIWCWRACGAGRRDRAGHRRHQCPQRQSASIPAA